MAARITIFCHKSVGQITADEILAGIESADLWTIAEGFDVPDDLIESALANLRIETLESDGEFKFILSYGRESIDQCRIERWTQPDSVEAVIEEHREMITGLGATAASAIQKRIQGAEEIVFVQFGSAPGMEFAPALASEVARWIAEKGAGIIEGADRTWWELGEWQEYQPLIP